MKIILLRHGESRWNIENKFTGWTDVPLTDNGINEAKFAGKKFLSEKIKINSIFTSLLLRATDTAKIVAKILSFDLNNIVYDARLNERHYGALQGLNKAETAKKYGEEQVKIWRRSYDIPPPLLIENDKRHPIFDPKFSDLTFKLPSGESLKDVVKRLEPFFIKTLENLKGSNGNHLIVAHSNSLRAIIMILEKLSKKEIISVNLPTGIPLVYELDSSLNIVNKKFLINEDLLKQKQEDIINQGRTK